MAAVKKQAYVTDCLGGENSEGTNRKGESSENIKREHNFPPVIWTFEN
jgi:hypothetical protein